MRYYKMSVIQSFNENTFNYKESLFLLFNSSPLPCFIVETGSFKIKAANESAVDFYEYGSTEFAELSFSDLHVAESKTKFLHQFKDKSKIRMAKGIFNQQKKHGTVVSVELYANSIDINNQPYFQISVVEVMDKIATQNNLSTETTERKKTEEKIRLLAHLVEETSDVLPASYNEPLYRKVLA